MLTGPFNARRSNAKTAYGLMSDIAAYVLEEPKWVYMGDWLIRGKWQIREAFNTAAPACGTVGCIAGNAVVLTGQVKSWRLVAALALETLGGGDGWLVKEDTLMTKEIWNVV